MQGAGRRLRRSGGTRRGHGALSGALGTAFRPREDGERIPPFQAGRGGYRGVPAGAVRPGLD